VIGDVVISGRVQDGREGLGRRVSVRSGGGKVFPTAICLPVRGWLALDSSWADTSLNLPLFQTQYSFDE